METKAHNILIGAFVLAFTAGIFAFVIWLAKGQIDRETARYDIVFTDSVAGLGVGGDVRFNGIKVGSVTRIAIDRDDPARVRVTVEIDAETPIRADSLATLQLQGITGVSFVQITAGTTQAPLLPRTAEPPWSVIDSRPSKISELVEGLPEVVNRGSEALSRISEIVDVQNRANLAAMLEETRKLTQSIGQRADALGRLIDNLDTVSAEMVTLGRQLQGLTARSQSMIDDVGHTLGVLRGTISAADQILDGEMRGTVVAFGRLATEMAQLIGENRPALDAFAAEGLPEFRRFIDEARQLVKNLGRVTTKIEDDPSQVIFGAQDSEFQPEPERRR
jgi:phospholipid/cholesterol/gamma-HCH transport system substrate-binding protein